MWSPGHDMERAAARVRKDGGFGKCARFGPERVDANGCPGAIELVYDNYNALAIGFAAS
jgi:hypothetical protein